MSLSSFSNFLVQHPKATANYHHLYKEINIHLLESGKEALSFDDYEEMLHLSGHQIQYSQSGERFWRGVGMKSDRECEDYLGGEDRWDGWGGLLMFEPETHSMNSRIQTGQSNSTYYERCAAERLY